MDHPKTQSVTIRTLKIIIAITAKRLLTNVRNRRSTHQRIHLIAY